MNNMVSRNQSHEKIFIALYGALIYIDLNEEIAFKEILANAFELDYEEIPLSAKETFIYALKNLNEIINLMNSKMENWNFLRLEKTIQAILIMSYAEAKTLKTTKAIIINVAIKLAKKYGDNKAYKFVNALLDNILC